jgi:hypothetical protein
VPTHLQKWPFLIHLRDTGSEVPAVASVWTRILATSCRLFAPAPSAGCQRIVQLHQHNGGDTYPRIDKAEGCPYGIEALSDHDAFADALAHLVRRVVFEQAGANDILPAPIKHHPGGQDVEPIEEQGAAVGDELRQQARGQRQQRDREQKAQMNPGQVARTFADVVQLRLPGRPRRCPA